MITDHASIEELGVQLALVQGTIRIASRHQGTVFVCSVAVPGGSATMANASLGNALAASIAFLRMHAPRQIEAVAPAEPADEPVRADPEGARIGPAPQRNGTETHAGYLMAVHCASCGYGEDEGECFVQGQPCPNCATVGRSCARPPHHDEDHDFEGS
jgi:hypothetical protein